MERIYVVCAPGLEPYTRRELQALGIHLPETDSAPTGAEESGGLEFDGTVEDLYRANLYLRTASRVMVRLGEFNAAAFSELRKKAGRLAWSRYLKPGQAVALRVTCHKSRLYHSGAVAERILGAIGDQLGAVPPVVRLEDAFSSSNPTQLVVVRLVNDQCTISLDSSGELLHRRGYRLAVAKASLRETLAAGLLMASGWDDSSPLLDPFCGSGTIAIEAALMARHIAPGLYRRFTFQRWHSFDSPLWQRIWAEAKETPPPDVLPVIQASDRDAGAIQMARENAERAGVAENIEFTCRAVSAVEPPAGSGWVVTNPPYGVRASADKDLRNLYAQIGHVLRAHCPGWRTAILSSSVTLLRHTGIPTEATLALINGGMGVHLALGRVPHP